MIKPNKIKSARTKYYNTIITEPIDRYMEPTNLCFKEPHDNIISTAEAMTY